MALRGSHVTAITLTEITESAALVTVEPAYAARRGVNFFVHCDQAGTAKTYYVDPAGNERELLTRTFTANVLLVLDHDYPVPQVLIRITPDSQPAVVSIEGVQYGS